VRFSQDFIEKVREANNIVEIIGQHTELKGSGHRLMGRCPFPDHSDKSPSFSVTEDNQLYYCYGCKKGGNVYTFLETYNGLSFPEAVEYLARRASIPMPEPDSPKERSRQGPSRDQKDLLLKVNRAAAVFYHQQLKGLEEDHPAKLYLQKRGLTEDTIEKFRIGYATEEWQGLDRHFRSRKVPIALAEALGLLKAKKGVSQSAQSREDTHFDLYRDRIMFPIFSPSSDVIGFGGRTLGDGLPKYLNSHDSAVFNKSRVLYGLHETGKFIRAQDSAVVVEGYMDAIALYTAGIKNVVAILGTAFTPEHARLLKRYSLNVTMLLDGDEAGITAAERSLPILLEAGIMPKGLLLPEKMDPDDFVKAHGGEKLKEEIERSAELFNLLLSRRWMQNYRGSPSEKVRIVEEAAGVMRNMANAKLRELYMLELSRQLDVEIQWVRKSLQQTIRDQGQSALKPQIPAAASVPAVPPASAEADEHQMIEEVEVPKIELKGAPRDEAFVLGLLIHYEGLMKELMEAGPEEVFLMITHPGVRHALEFAIARYRAKPEGFSGIAASLATAVDQPGVITSAMGIVPATAPEGTERKLMGDYLTAIRQRYLKTQGKALASQLRDQASPEKLEEFMILQRNRISVNRDS
jgi:DNA primase